MFALKRIDCERHERNYFLVVESGFEEVVVPYIVHGIVRVDNNMKSPREVLTKDFSEEANQFVHELQNLAYSQAFEN